MRSIAFGTAILAIVSCTSERNPPGDTFDDIQPAETAGLTTPDEADPPPPPPQPGLSLQITQNDGEFFPPPVVPDKDGVYFRLRGLANNADTVDADYWFRVVDQAGQLRSTDDEACRRFHVNARGRIDDIVPGVDASGAACEHRVGSADDTSRTPQLMPFADTDVDADGHMHYVLEVGPVGTQHPALTVAFIVRAPRCGDGALGSGEVCDDGNVTDGDGCSATCTIEPACEAS